MENQNIKSGNWADRNKKSSIQLSQWSIIWMLSTAVATFGHIFLWKSSVLLTVLAILINTLIGFGMIRAYKRWLKELDEMQNKIQLEAMALSLGVGLVCGLSYSLLDITNIISSDAEISHLIILMGLTYIAGVTIGRKRYQ